MMTGVRWSRGFSPACVPIVSCAAGLSEGEAEEPWGKENAKKGSFYVRQSGVAGGEAGQELRDRTFRRG